MTTIICGLERIICQTARSCITIVLKTFILIPHFSSEPGSSYLRIFFSRLTTKTHSSKYIKGGIQRLHSFIYSLSIFLHFLVSGETMSWKLAPMPQHLSLPVPAVSADTSSGSDTGRALETCGGRGDQISQCCPSLPLFVQAIRTPSTKHTPHSFPHPTQETVCHCESCNHHFNL